jgi:hypothetical protein
MLHQITRWFANLFRPRSTPASIHLPFPRQTLVLLHRYYMEDACCHQERKHVHQLARTMTLP